MPLERGSQGIRRSVVYYNILKSQICLIGPASNQAGLAQLGERQTEDLKVMCSIHITRIFLVPFPIFNRC